MKTKFLTFLILMASATFLQAQDIEGTINGLTERVKKQPVKISGGAAINNNFSQTFGLPNRLTPYYLQANANLMLDVLGLVQIPFSSVYSTRKVVLDYKLPSYNFTGFSPTYKWATLHIGDRSMLLSDYTLNGLLFRGAGFELRPNNWRFAAMYGRLQAARIEDINSLQAPEPNYRRMGFGAKAGYEKDGDMLELCFFKVEDQENSIPTPVVYDNVKPEASTTISVKGSKKLSKKLSVGSEYARSAYTTNLLSDFDSPDVVLSRMFGLLRPRTTTSYYNAVKSDLTLNLAKAKVSLNHEWVEPGFRTLGTLFFHDDFQNLTATFAFPAPKLKMNFVLNGGIEENNLRNTKLAKDTRFVGSAAISYAPSKAWNMGLNLTNHRSTNRLRTSVLPVLAIDSIVLAVVNQSASYFTSYRWNKERPQSISFISMYNRANSITNNVVDNSRKLSIYNFNLNYNYDIKEKNFGVMTGINTSFNESIILKRLAVTPTFGLKKDFPKIKMTSNIRAGYSRIVTNEVVSSNLLSSQLSIGYTPHKKHSFSLNTAFIKNFPKLVNNKLSPAFSELSGALNYNFSF